MPLLLPAVASELRWSKTESGIVLSSFFWGYTVTQVTRYFHQTNRKVTKLIEFVQFQVLGGYFSDRIGGQRVIFSAAVAWSLITFWMPNLLTLTSRQWYYSIPFIVTIRYDTKHPHFELLRQTKIV